MLVFYALFYKNLLQISGCYVAKSCCFPGLLANWCLTLKRNTVYLAGLQVQPIVRHFGKVLMKRIRWKFSMMRWRKKIPDRKLRMPGKKEKKSACYNTI